MLPTNASTTPTATDNGDYVPPSEEYLNQRDACVKYFDQWNELEQVYFVQHLISHMCHYQHGQVNVFLMPMLQRDFISALPGRFTVLLFSYTLCIFVIQYTLYPCPLVNCFYCWGFDLAFPDIGQSYFFLLSVIVEKTIPHNYYNKLCIALSSSIQCTLENHLISVHLYIFIHYLDRTFKWFL